MALTIGLLGARQLWIVSIGSPLILGNFLSARFRVEARHASRCAICYWHVVSAGHPNVASAADRAFDGGKRRSRRVLKGNSEQLEWNAEIRVPLAREQRRFGGSTFEQHSLLAPLLAPANKGNRTSNN